MEETTVTILLIGFIIFSFSGIGGYIIYKTFIMPDIDSNSYDKNITENEQNIITPGHTQEEKKEMIKNKTIAPDSLMAK